jgi:hypothetical protein
MYRGFSRFWFVLSCLLGAFAWFINDAKEVILTFIIVMAIGHGMFWVFFWIAEGFRE